MNIRHRSAITLMTLSLLAMGAWGQLPHPFDLSSLDGANGVRLVGTAWRDKLGLSVSGAGDVNGDGLADLLIGAPGVDIGDDSEVGVTHLIYGTVSGIGNGAASFELSSLDGTAGVRFEGIDAYDKSGHSVSGAGDVNGDGLADLLIGACRADLGGGYSDEGETYLVYGSTSITHPFDLSELDGRSGLRLDGIQRDSVSGSSVSGAGDIDSDGLADLVIGAPDNMYISMFAGEAYLVYGSTELAHPIDLSSLDGITGAHFNGTIAGDLVGRSVSGAGDVNGDGIADLLFGVPGTNLNGVADVGEAYLLFGSTSSVASGAASVRLPLLDGVAGIRFSGEDSGDNLGFSVSSAGDVNGDGFADLLLAANSADSPSSPCSGEIYVIYGSTMLTHPFHASSIDGTNGVILRGTSGNAHFEYRVSGAGDVNGDGLADLLIGAPSDGERSTDDQGQYGRAYLIYGSAMGIAGGASSMELSCLDGANGVQFDGINVDDWFGYSVSGTGDINGDGFADLIMGAPYPAFSVRSETGDTYIIYGSGRATQATCRAFCRSGDAPRLGVGLPGDGSITTPSSRCWINYDGGSGPGNRGSSLETVTLTRGAASIRNLGDGSVANANVMWEISTNRTGWASAEVTFNYLDREIPVLIEDSLLLVQAPTPEGPWVVAQDCWRDTRRNQIGGTVTEMGYFAIGGQRDPAAPRTEDILNCLLGFTEDDTGLDITGDEVVDTADLILSINIDGEG